MRVIALLLCTGLAAGALVKREAEAEADYVSHGGYTSTPVCTLTPVRTCTPRQIETPRKVCQTVVDHHEDTVVREHCREVVTTTCTQTTQTATQTSAVVDTFSRLLQEGVPKPLITNSKTYVKRSAEAEAEAEPKAEAEAEAHYGGVTVISAPVVLASPPSSGYPVCNSVPVKTCERVPTSTPRKVARTVCDTVVDVTTIEDCVETVTKHCQHTSSSTSSNSKVVAKESTVLGIARQAAPLQAIQAVAHPAAYQG